MPHTKEEYEARLKELKEQRDPDVQYIPLFPSDNPPEGQIAGMDAFPKGSKERQWVSALCKEAEHPSNGRAAYVATRKKGACYIKDKDGTFLAWLGHLHGEVYLYNSQADGSFHQDSISRTCLLYSPEDFAMRIAKPDPHKIQERPKKKEDPLKKATTAELLKRLCYDPEDAKMHAEERRQILFDIIDHDLKSYEDVTSCLEKKIEEAKSIKAKDPKLEEKKARGISNLNADLAALKQHYKK